MPSFDQLSYSPHNKTNNTQYSQEYDIHMNIKCDLDNEQQHRSQIDA